MKIYLLFFILLFFHLSISFSQENRNCKIDEGRNSKFFYPFQTQLQNYIIDKRKKQTRAEDEIYIIPVIVHVMHLEEETLGEGTNIPNKQIISQIQRLNEDFRRMNKNRQDTRKEFEEVASDTQIQFVLASFDTLGNILPEKGIVRHISSKYKWSITELEQIVKPSTIWNPDNYLNIWTVGKINAYIGYAQFPDLSGLAGLLPDEEGNRFTDGVVVDHNRFGDYSIEQVAILENTRFNLGRTLTHEIGHFLGLLHPWGVFTGCDDEDDFCEDTPLISSSTNGCNTDRQSCGQLSMPQNYMDYTWDSCMNLFTINQTERMRAVLEVSPRRKSLLTSNVVGLEQEGIFSQIKIYPNPSQNYITIEDNAYFSKMKIYQIRNLTGSVLIHGQFENKMTKVDVSNLPSGIYLVNIQGFDSFTIKKIVVK